MVDVEEDVELVSVVEHDEGDVVADEEGDLFAEFFAEDIFFLVFARQNETIISKFCFVFMFSCLLFFRVIDINLFLSPVF